MSEYADRVALAAHMSAQGVEITPRMEGNPAVVIHLDCGCLFLVLQKHYESDETVWEKPFCEKPECPCGTVGSLPDTVTAQRWEGNA